MLKEFFKSKKRIAVASVLAVLVIGLFSGGGSAPVLELKEPAVYYGNELAFSDFVDVTNKAPEEVQLTITADPAKNVSINQEKQRIKFQSVGEYKLEITAEDTEQQVSSETMEVVVADGTEPKIVLNGKFSIDATEDAPDYLEQLKAKDAIDGDLSDWIVVDDSAVEYGKVGSYMITATVEDNSGNICSKKFPVTIEDTEEQEVDAEADADSYTSYASNSYSDSSDDYDDYEEESYSGGGTVYVTQTGECYHTHACGNGNYYEASLAEAEARGLRPCQKCY